MNRLSSCVSVVLLMCTSTGFAVEVPEDLAAVVESQRVNRVESAARITQRAIQLKQAGKPEQAKQMKKLAEDVKRNKAIAFECVGHNSSVGYLCKGVVSNREEDWVVVKCLISESTGRQETTQYAAPGVGVMTVGTGRAETLPQNRVVKLYSRRRLAVQDDVSSVPCRLKKTDDGYVATELSEEELAAAMAVLNKKK